MDDSFAGSKYPPPCFPFEEDVQVERLPVGQLRRIMSFGPDAPPVNPLYTGLLWKGNETSLKMLKHLTNADAT